ncbi:MAG: hypothetical protein ACN2B6_12155 [Rickettsiales bacterium]
MAFDQKKLDKSVNQSRGIFDKYVYRTDDAISDVEAVGYFSSSRFASDSDWLGSLIECQCSDGYIFGTLGAGGSISTLFNSNVGGSGMPIAPSDSDYYVAQAGNWFNAPGVLSVNRTPMFSSQSAVSQQPTAVDTPIRVSFGSGFGTGSDPIMLDSSGLFTINETGNYHFFFVFQYGRSGSSGTSWVWFHSKINGTPVSTPSLAKLENANVNIPFASTGALTLTAGATLEIEIWRGSEGNNSGGLIAESPALAGVLPGASALVQVAQYSLSNA